jgi:hypothetical protein
MGFINDPVTGANQDRVGEVASGATGVLHETFKPVPTLLGHYRVNHHPTVAAWGGGNRTFQFRNPAVDRIAVLTHFVVKILVFTSGVAQTDIGELDFTKVTNFTAMDSTNNTVLTPSAKRANMSPPRCQVEGMTAIGTAGAGFAGTLDPIAGYAVGGIAQLTTQPTTWNTINFTEMEDDVNGTHPWVFSKDEGFLISPRLNSGGTVSAYFDLSWAEISVPDPSNY